METPSVLRYMLESMGLEPRSYSGRGMYGDVCLGVALYDTKVIDVLLDLTMAFMDDIWEDENADIRDEVAEFIDRIKNHKTDSLGHGIILYWPRERWE